MNTKILNIFKFEKLKKECNVFRFVQLQTFHLGIFELKNIKENYILKLQILFLFQGNKSLMREDCHIHYLGSYTV